MRVSVYDICNKMCEDGNLNKKEITKIVDNYFKIMYECNNDVRLLDPSTYKYMYILMVGRVTVSCAYYSKVMNMYFNNKLTFFKRKCIDRIHLAKKNNYKSYKRYENSYFTGKYIGLMDNLIKKLKELNNADEILYD